MVVVSYFFLEPTWIFYSSKKIINTNNIATIEVIMTANMVFSGDSFLPFSVIILLIIIKGTILKSGISITTENLSIELIVFHSGIVYQLELKSKFRLMCGGVWNTKCEYKLL